MKTFNKSYILGIKNFIKTAIQKIPYFLDMFKFQSFFNNRAGYLQVLLWIIKLSPHRSNFLENTKMDLQYQLLHSSDYFQRAGTSFRTTQMYHYFLKCSEHSGIKEGSESSRSLHILPQACYSHR